MKKQFYEKASPSQGVYCVMSITDKVINRFAESLSQLHQLIDSLKDSSNVFVAPLSFNSYSRSADNAAFARSFFIDLDVGQSEKKYSSKQDALTALTQFVKDSDLPPPVVIDSGGGVHAYWLFDEDIPVSEWKPYAKLFKAYCAEKGLLIDPAVTADAARVMRCPETFNFKTDPPLPTAVIQVDGLDPDIYQYDFKMFKEHLGTPEPELTDILKDVQRGLDEDTIKMLKFDNYEKSFELLVRKSLGLEEGQVGCNQIKYIIENETTLREPMWRAGLSIAWHCEDRETAIHLMSERHPGYNRESTNTKAKQTDGKPQGCAQFESENPGGCDGCPHRGKIKNPLALCRVFREAPTASNAVWKVPDPKEVPKFPDFLKPYVRGINGGVYYLPPVEKDDEGAPVQSAPIMVFRHDIYPLRRMFSPHDGDCLEMRVSLPHDEDRDFLLPMSISQAQEALKTTLPKHGATFDNKHITHVMAYIKKWDEFMKEYRAADQMRMQMGWTEKKDAFVIGNIEIIPSGDKRVAPASPFVRNIAKLLRPVGNYNLWKESFNALNEPGFEMHAYGGLLGFGSTLIHHTSTSGAVISFAGDSGVAKTGALYACLSIWGNPKELSVFDATDNGMVGRYLGLHNLPLGCDEVSNKKPDQLSNLIHRISHGKAKIRMQGSVNAERDIEFSASLLALFTTNQPVADKMMQLKNSPDGEMARIIEFNIRKPAPLAKNPERGREIFDVFRTNYGWAGPEFAVYCFKVGFDYIQNLVDKWINKFRQSFGADVAYRFYENLTAATFAAGELAVEAKIINIDIDRVFRVVVSNMCSIRDNTPLNSLDYRALVGEFVLRNQRNFLILNEGDVIGEPYGPLVGRTEVHAKTRYISKTEFRKFLAEYQVSIRDFENALREDGMLVYHGKQRLSNGWKNGSETPPIAVYGLRYDEAG